MHDAGRSSGRQGAAAAAAAFLLAEVLRVWLPTVSVGVAQRTTLLPSGAGLAGLLVLAVAPLALGAGWLTLRRAWWVGAALLLAGRLALVAPTTLTTRTIATSAAVLGGSLVLSVLAADGAGHRGRLAVLAGVVASTWVHAALATLDLAWRDGPGATTATLAVVAVAAVTVGRAGPRSTPVAHDPAWPWLALGPALALLLALVGVPGRIATATGWSASLAAAVAVLCTGATLVTALATTGRLRTAAPAGGLLVIVGTLGAIPASSPTAVGAQLLLAVGLGVVTGAAGAGSATDVDRSDEPGGVRPSPPVRRRAAASGVGWLLVGVVAVGELASLELRHAPPARSFVLAATLAVAAAALAARRRPAGGHHAAAPRTILTATLATLAVAAGVGAAPAEPLTGPETGAPGAPVRLVLLNTGSGFDVDARFDPLATAAALRSLEPDVVVLHEVDRGWLVTGGHDQLALLAAELDMPAVFAPAADELAGTALFTRYPVLEHSVERLPRGSDRTGRSQLAAVLEVAPGQHLGVVAARLSRVDPQADSRLPQARAVAATVAQLRQRGVPTVMLGTLSVPPGHPVVGTFETLLSPAIPDGVLTEPSTAPTWQPDHIMVSPDLVHRDLEVLDVQVAEHRPVAVTVAPHDP